MSTLQANSKDLEDYPLDVKYLNPLVKTMIKSSSAIDKTLSKTLRIRLDKYKKKAFGTMNELRIDENGDLIRNESKNKLLPKSQPFDHVSLPLLQCKIFLSLCWNSFESLSMETMYTNDSNHHRILYIDKIYPALHSISSKLKEKDVIAYIKQNNLKDNVLIWNDFKAVASYLLTPIVSNLHRHENIHKKSTFHRSVKSDLEAQHMNDESSKTSAKNSTYQHISQFIDTFQTDMDAHSLHKSFKDVSYEASKSYSTSDIHHQTVDLSGSLNQSSYEILMRKSRLSSVVESNQHDGFIRVPTAEYCHIPTSIILKQLKDNNIDASLQSDSHQHHDSNMKYKISFNPNIRSNDYRKHHTVKHDHDMSLLTLPEGMPMIMPARIFKDESVELFKTEFRSLSSADLGIQKNSSSAHSMKPDLRIIKRDMITKDVSMDVLNRPRFQRPLEKQKTFELTHPKDSYSNKWMKMKAIRDGRLDAIETRRQNEDLKHALNKTVISSDRAALHDALVKIEEEYDHVRVSYGRTHRERQRQAHREAKKMRRCEVKEKQLHRKSLLKAIDTSASLSKSSLLDEQNEKYNNKPQMISKLIVDSSSKVYFNDNNNSLSEEEQRYAIDIPEEELKDLKKKSNQYYRNVMDGRISRYNESKSLARLKSLNIGDPVSIIHLDGEMYFEDAKLIARASLSQSNTNDGYNPLQDDHLDSAPPFLPTLGRSYSSASISLNELSDNPQSSKAPSRKHLKFLSDIKNAGKGNRRISQESFMDDSSFGSLV